MSCAIWRRKYGFKDKADVDAGSEIFTRDLRDIVVTTVLARPMPQVAQRPTQPHQYTRKMRL
jgi:hypothetical protein